MNAEDQHCCIVSTKTDQYKACFIKCDLPRCQSTATPCNTMLNGDGQFKSSITLKRISGVSCSHRARANIL